MKKLIIILAVVGLTLVALLVYGANRSEQPKRACEQLPPTPPGEDPDSDAMEDWCPPDLIAGISDKTRGLQAKFAPDLGIEPVEKSTSPQFGEQFLVAPSKEPARGAHVELIAGDFVILDGNGDVDLCLCRPGTAMDARLFASHCSKDWKAKHREKAKPGQANICQKNDHLGMLPFQEPGGVIKLLPGPPARVRIE